MEVLKLYFTGYSYDEIEIVQSAKVSKDSVVNIIKELKECRYPELESVLDLVDKLRELAVEIRKNNLEIPQASLGLKFYERFRRLGVEPQILDDYIKMCERISLQTSQQINLLTQQSIFVGLRRVSANPKMKP